MVGSLSSWIDILARCAGGSSSGSISSYCIVIVVLAAVSTCTPLDVTTHLYTNALQETVEGVEDLCQAYKQGLDKINIKNITKYLKGYLKYCTVCLSLYSNLILRHTPYNRVLSLVLL